MRQPGVFNKLVEHFQSKLDLARIKWASRVDPINPKLVFW